MDPEHRSPALVGPSGQALAQWPPTRLIRQFAATESAGGVLLLVAAVVALVWANTPLRGSYAALWTTEAAVRVGPWELAHDLRHWVNDGAMTLFFLVVGAEIKRELVVGELRGGRQAALPVIAAAGGMLVPALVYLALNLGGPGAPGWGIPTATDIAFALGALALLGDRVPSGLKVLLLAIAIADDIGAIVLIALAYSSGVSALALVVAAVLVAAMSGLRRVGLWWLPVHVVLGIGVWLAMSVSGVHAAIAGVVLGLLAPARPLVKDATAPAEEDHPHEWTHLYAEWLRLRARESVPVTERVTGMLHPWTSFLIVPVFALANAGVPLSSPGAHTAVTAGVTLGLLVGKPVGITAAIWLATRAGVGQLPEAVRWRHVIGMATLAGIGFTVSLFITDLAFADAAPGDAARIGILAGSALAAVAGLALLRTSRGAADERS